MDWLGDRWSKTIRERNLEDFKVTKTKINNNLNFDNGRMDGEVRRFERDLE